MNDFSKRRLDLYYLISSLELDLRDFILTHNISIDCFDEKINKRMSESTNSIYEKIDKKARIMFLDFGEYFSLINEYSKNQTNSLFKELISNLELILPIRNRVMHTRPLADGDYDTVINFCKSCSKYCALFSLENFVSAFEDVKKLTVTSFEHLKKEQIYVDPRIENNLPIVDFDDTGFVGRAEKKKELAKKLRSAHAIISVIGNGGIGKTSLVLSYIYDNIDDPSFPFEKVLWVSLKTKTLQDGEFKDIKESIKSFDECIKKNKILNKESVRTIDNLLYYMSVYKTLLILDNLETIETDDVKELFEDIPIGSKILITSRIGIREYESRLNLGPFDIDEAVSYFRRLIKIYNVNQLSKISNENAKQYVKRLYCSPLCIKWFVINVAKGNSPDIVLGNQEELIEFCLSNVFDKLSDNAKHLVKILSLKQTPCFLAELIYINNNDYTSTLEAIHELCACNFLEANNDNRYHIPEFSFKYLSDKFDINSQEIQKLQQRINKLSGKVDNLQGDNLGDKSKPNTIVPTKRDEKIATIYMQSFIEAFDSNNLEQMNYYFDLAQKCSARFSDIYKTAGYYYGKLNQNNKALECYKSALEFCSQSDKPFIQSLFSLFLTNNTELFEEALNLINEALKVHPNNYYFLNNKVRVLKFTKCFNDALSIINEIIRNDDIDFYLRCTLINEYVDIGARKLDLISENSEKLVVFSEIVSFINKVEYKYYNGYLYRTILKFFQYSDRIKFNKKNSEIMKKFVSDFYPYMLFASNKASFEDNVALINKYLNVKITNDTEFKFAKKEEGKISKIFSESGYGFITYKGFQTGVFFHFSKLLFDYNFIHEGLLVLFTPMFSHNKWQAVDIEPSRDPDLE